MRGPEHQAPGPSTPREPAALQSATPHPERAPVLSPATPCQRGGSSRPVSRHSLQAHGGALTQDPTPPSGLLRLEELVRGFLISKETLSVRMLDDSRDPTPLLKEIRDDKVSTIIIDANASISHLILRKVGLHPPL